MEPVQVESGQAEHQDDIENDEHAEQHIEDYQSVRDRVKRVSKPTQRYCFSSLTDMLAYAFLLVAEVMKTEPETYEEAINSKESKNWVAAMKEEMNSLYKNETWITIKRPNNQSVVAYKWISKLKEGYSAPEGQVKYKARLVVKGGLHRNIFTHSKV